MKNLNFKKNIISALLLLIFGMLSFGSVDTDNDTKNIQSQMASYTLSANQLYDEYDSNEVAADTKYKGTVVIVSGRIHNIGKDVMSQAYIIIGGSGFLDGVQCTFTQSQESAIANLSKGQEVTVKGEVAGKMGNVVINKCSLQ